MKSAGGNKCPMIIRNDCSRCASDERYAFARFLSDSRLYGVPYEVALVRSDDGDESSEGKIGKLRRDRNIKPEFTTQ